MSFRDFSLPRLRFVLLPALMLAVSAGMVIPSFAAHLNDKQLAATPPMGWNDWAHYQCGYTAQDVLANARELVESGLAARGYNTVTIDDCWMQKDRDAYGNLQADLQRFPQGIKPVVRTIHAMGLKFGIYEDAGYSTCAGLAGSGVPDGGGKDHFLQDARLFASWGVDYLKLDACNVYVPDGATKTEAYRKAFAAESTALGAVNRPIVFSQSAPAYFLGTHDWYDVLSWVGEYGQLWREGSDIATFHAENPENPRFPSVLWNYSYNLILARFQKTSNWNDPDFIIGGDGGMSPAETRSQLALWSMMSAPLILSSDLRKLSPEAVTTLGNKAIIAIDQDPLGEMATLVRSSQAIDVLFKRLSDGEYAVAVLNRGPVSAQVELHPSDFGFRTTGCHLDAQDLWNGMHSSATALRAEVASRDTVIWRVHAGPSCHTPTRTGTIIKVAVERDSGHTDIKNYATCLAAPGRTEGCEGTAAEKWTVTPSGALESAGQCLTIVNGEVAMQACDERDSQHWRYTLVGNLIGRNGQCLTAVDPRGPLNGVSVQTCGHNQPNQIWSLPS